MLLQGSSRTLQGSHNRIKSFFSSPIYHRHIHLLMTHHSLLPQELANLSFDDPKRISYWTASRVRQSFLDYFIKHNDHTLVVSSPVVPLDDPTLLFTNSGMAQFKPIFQGLVDPNSDRAKLRRVANSQKCIRAGGKHNDLEDVGKDTYHHTFFEMLGNWSFGNYFKKEAIDMAWELLTKVWCLPKDRIYVTYFGGDSRYNLPEDLEAQQLWINVGMDPSRVLPFGMKENFWEMGDQGPCGPCSEIHFDRIGGRNVSHLVNQDDPMVLEIWNLVFMQYNREADGSLKSLPNKHVDTGSGLERVISVLQNKSSNYDTDLFDPIFRTIQKLCECRPYTGLVGLENDKDGIDMAYRVIADHIRTLTFAITDGGVPGNEGRGYVLRRILRRAVRYSHEKLKAKPGFFSSLVDVVVENMGDAFPELYKCPEMVKEILLEEEMQFRRTLERGIVQFDRFAKLAEQKSNKMISGSDAWRLYDTFGFPSDLTRLMAEERGLKVNEEEYKISEAEAKRISRLGKSGNVEEDPLNDIVLNVHILDEMSSKLCIPQTNDDFKYTDSIIEAKILALFKDNSLISLVNEQDETENNLKSNYFGIVLDNTNFYAESGGQIYDTGSITIDGRSEFIVEAVQSFGKYILHIGYLKYGNLSVNDKVIVTFDEIRRRALRQNHTATHLLNYALRKVLVDGDTDQKGSLVSFDKFRFDFNYKRQLALEEIEKIEEIVNKAIESSLQVSTKVLSLEVAKSIMGLRAVFGEVYPDPVRVVAVGGDLDTISSDPNNSNWMGLSIELCGGTHVSRSSDIRNFIIISEGNIAKGIRRIVAVTGEAALVSKQLQSKLKEKLDSIERNPSLESQNEDLKIFSRTLDEAQVSCLFKNEQRDRIELLRQKLGDVEKQMRNDQIKLVTDKITNMIQSFSSSSSIPTQSLIIERFNVGDNGKALLAGLNLIKDSGRSGLLYSVDPITNRVIYHSVISENHVKAGISAVDLLKKFDEEIAQGIKEKANKNDVNECEKGGKSGGKPSAAQGSATISPNLSIDYERIESVIESMIKIKLN